MAVEKPVALTQVEKDTIHKALTMLQTSYGRAQKQRPEFAPIAAKMAEDITFLIVKIKAL